MAMFKNRQVQLLFLAALGPPGLHTTTQELQTCTFHGPGASYTTIIPREDPQERQKERKWGGIGKKTQIFWPSLPSGSLAQNGLAKIGLAQIGQVRMAKNGLAKNGLSHLECRKKWDKNATWGSCELLKITQRRSILTRPDAQKNTNLRTTCCRLEYTSTSKRNLWKKQHRINKTCNKYFSE